MNPDYWIHRWNENRIGFHRAGTNPLLERFWPGVVKVASGRVLVPLCGKSADMKWLADRGHEVVGVDLSEIAATSFASEQRIALNRMEVPPFNVYRGERIAIYVGNFFDLTPDKTGLFDLVYDRAALIALPPEMRPAYARHMQSLLNPGGHGLLISLDYDTSKMEGPPFAVPEAEVRTLLAACVVDKLHEYDCLEEEPRFKERGVRWMKEVVYGLSK